jgi:hypothetical protein
MKKLITIILTILTTYTLGATMTTQLAKSKKFPIYKLDITTFGCGYDFRVNDVSIQYNRFEGGNVVEIPVNDFMINGKNTISMYLYSSGNTDKPATHEQECTAKVSLNLTYPALDISHTLATMSYQAPANQLKAQMSDTNKNQDVYTIDSNNNYQQSDNSGDIKVSKTEITAIKGIKGPSVKLDRAIVIPNVGLPQWAWEHSDVIKNDPETKASLMKQYDLLMHSIETKNFDKVKDIFDERDHELSLAYPSNKPKGGTLEQLIQAANNPNLKLLPFDPKQDGDLYIYANGRLATIQGWDASPVVLFNYKDDSGSKVFYITFRRQNGKWIIAR